MDIDVRNLGRVAAVSAAAVTALQAATAVTAIRAGRRDYADAVWGPGLAAVALVGATVGQGDLQRITRDYPRGGAVPLVVERGDATVPLSVQVAPQGARP